MVRVNITDFGFVIDGHADYDERGYDIVCSAISALSQSVAMALKLYSRAKVFNTSGHIGVDLDERSDISNMLLNTLRMGLLEIQKEYPKHILVRTKKGVFK